MTISISPQGVFSRRTLLLGCVAGGAAAMATRASALQPSPVKVSKDCVHYQTIAEDGHRCSACKLFVAPSACIAEVGDIGHDCGCRIWLPRGA